MTAKGKISQGRQQLLAGLVACGCSLVFPVMLTMLVIDFAQPNVTAAQLWGRYAVPAAMSALLLTAFFVVSRRFWQNSNPKVAAFLVVLVALVARLFVVFFSTPQLSDDIWRYLHDGITLSSGQNPYAIAPTDVQPQDVEHAQILAKVNHPDLVTIYQPTSQWVFAAAMSIGRSDRVMRFVFVLFDMAIVLMLLAKLRNEGQPIWWAALYAWHPLVISEVASSGHQDVIGIAFMLAALLLHESAEKSKLRAVLAGAAFGAAVAVKPFVLPLALPLAWSIHRQPARLAASFAGAFVIGVALYLPFVMMPGGISELLNTGDQFVDQWQFNGSVHRLLIAFGISFEVAQWLCLALLACVFGMCMRLRLDLWRFSSVFLFAALLLSSTAYPWYLLWALAFLPVRFSWALWIYSFTTMFSYEVLTHPTEWEVPVWLSVVIYLPVFVAIGWDVWRWKIGKKLLTADGADVLNDG